MELGIAVPVGSTGHLGHYRGGEGVPRSSALREESSALWRLLATHAGHHFTALYEGAERWRELYVGDLGPDVVGGDADLDIPFEDFLYGWREGDQAGLSVAGHGVLRCLECGAGLWLGKAYGAGPDEVSFFHAGAGAGGGRGNSANVPVNRALWRFLAEHVMHELSVGVNGEAPAAVIGGTDGPSFEDYVAGWPG
ncbi:hypothetical protein [Krasilnikovia sp. M28-CT-15]|uniref:hypothetical protein n=1 Tax=Krasilnikovia sp. M28-CT-15 TaxID=3373540 RepID=UPI003876A087